MKILNDKYITGKSTASRDWLEHGEFANPFVRGTDEHSGYCDERERVILLGDLLTEQAGSMGV